MLDKSRSQRILNISLPIIGAMVSQNILNLVDSAMVGSLGTAALGAVGLGGFLNFMAVAFFIGFGVGVQAMVARRMGQGRVSEAAEPLNGALLVILLSSLPVTAVLYVLTPWLMSLVNADPAVQAEGVPYLQARFLGIMFLGFHFCFRGFWSGIDMTRVYLQALLLAHASNVLISYVLIFGHLGLPALGTRGAGLGTAMSMVVSSAYYFHCARKLAGGHGFLSRRPNWHTIGQMLKTALPASLQQFFFAAGFTALFWIVGQIGTAELAATNVIVNLMLAVILPSLGIGIGGATLVGQALGRGQSEDAHRWGWDAAKLAFLVSLAISLPALIFPQGILSVFLHEQHALEVAVDPLRITALFIALEAIGMVLFNAINGAGDTKTTLLVSFVLQWFLFLPMAWLLGPFWGMGLTAIWIAQVSYRGLMTVIMVIIWQRRRWADVEFA